MSLRLGCRPILTLTLGLLLSAGAQAQPSSGPGATAPPETTQYDFKIGRWQLEATSMRADRSLVRGSGTSEVSYIHGGRSVQDDIQVTFEDGTGFIGTTFRTYDPAAGAWVIVWLSANGPASLRPGRGHQDGDQMVEVWNGEDEHGEHVDRLKLFDIEKDSHTVRMDRTYANGDYLIEGIWSYRATRIE